MAVNLFASELRRYTWNLPPVCKACGYDILLFQLRGRSAPPAEPHFIHWPNCPRPWIPPHPYCTP